MAYNLAGANPSTKVAVVSDQSIVANATIAISTSLSAAVDCDNARLAKINMPAGWDAANLTFQTSADNVTFRNLYDATGAEYTVVAAASRSIILNLGDWLGSRYIKVRSGTSAAPVNQTAGRTIELVLVP